MTGDERAYLFGLGCDARLAGIPLEDNPYILEDGRVWKEGWLYVEKHWGDMAKRPVKKLPKIQGSKSTNGWKPKGD